MCCPILLIAFFGPRVALVFLWFTMYLEGVWSTPLWPLLGFVFMPYTTLAYAVAMHNGGVKDLWLVILIVAAVLDLGVHGGSTRRGRWVRVDDDD